MIGILEKDNQVFMIKRNNTGYMDWYWAFPGGRLDPNEDPINAAVREVREEVGCHIDLNAPYCDHIVYMNRNIQESDWLPESAFIYGLRTSNFEGEPVNLEPQKCSECWWFDIDNLPSPIIPVQYELFIKTGLWEKGISVISWTWSM